jgi:hypothetical protein
MNDKYESMTEMDQLGLLGCWGVLLSYDTTDTMYDTFFYLFLFGELI